jgi:hypothetical protein
MAPWNIVLNGPNLDYIDYDTKEFTYDKDVPKAYMVKYHLKNISINSLFKMFYLHVFLR